MLTNLLATVLTVLITNTTSQDCEYSKQCPPSPSRYDLNTVPVNTDNGIVWMDPRTFNSWCDPTGRLETVTVLRSTKLQFDWAGKQRIVEEQEPVSTQKWHWTRATESDTQRFTNYLTISTEKVKWVKEAVGDGFEVSNYGRHELGCVIVTTNGSFTVFTMPVISNLIFQGTNTFTAITNSGHTATNLAPRYSVSYVTNGYFTIPGYNITNELTRTNLIHIERKPWWRVWRRLDEMDKGDPR